MLRKAVFIFFLLSFAPTVLAIPVNELDRIVNAQSQLLTEYQQNVVDLQHEVDVLRGQLQEATYKLEQTIERQKMILKQLDSSQVQSLNKKETDQNIMSKDLQNGMFSGDEKADYNTIVNGILKGKEPNFAIGALQQFIKQYPNSQYLSNANYWLGQLNYRQNKKEEASYYFANVVKKYPKSSKAAESMFKVGLILQEEGEQDKANLVFEQVIAKYPHNTKIVDSAKERLKQ